MGHENESLDDFVKAHDACQEDLMYFPGRNTCGLASVAGNSEKLAALQNDFEIMKKRMDDEAKKATKLEQKVKLLTHGHQTRAGKLWMQIEATFKQMDTAATELECFKALQKQEVLAASYRVSDLVEEVKKQKGLERNLQQRYADLIAEHDRVQRLLEEHKERVRLEEEIAAKNRALEEEIAAKNWELEEEIAAKSRALEEEVAAKNHALEEVIPVVTVIEDEVVEKNYSADEEMADVVTEDLDHPNEPATGTGTSVISAKDVESDGKVENCQTDAASSSAIMDEMMTVVPNSEIAGVSDINPATSNQTVVADGSIASDSSAQVVSDVTNQVDDHANDNILGSPKGITCDSSNQMEVPSLVGSDENLVSNASDSVKSSLEIDMANESTNPSSEDKT